MTNSLMIHWEERHVWCNMCDTWVHANDIWIDGTHDTPRGTRTDHTVWEPDNAI